MRLGLLLVLPLLAGCSYGLHGTWELDKAYPSAEVFAVNNVTFDSDGRYSASVTEEGRTHEDTGTYELSGNKLHLRPEAGGVRTYRAVVRMLRLEINSGKARAVLKKVR